MMHGAAWRALRKTSRTPVSDSPTHLDSSSGPLTEMKFTSLSVATALASSVLPHARRAGSRMPLGGRTRRLAKSSGMRSGHSTAS